MKSFLKAFHREDTGSSLVEFGIVSVLMLTLFSGSVTLGQMLKTSTDLENISREVARYAVGIPFNPLTQLPLNGDTNIPPTFRDNRLDPGDPQLQAFIPQIVDYYDSTDPNSIQIYNTVPYDGPLPDTPVDCDDLVTVVVEAKFGPSFFSYLGLAPSTLTKTTTMRYEQQDPCS